MVALYFNDYIDVWGDYNSVMHAVICFYNAKMQTALPAEINKSLSEE